jgi:hypothetical protein
MTILSRKINYRILSLVLICFLLLKTSFGQTPVVSQSAPALPQPTALQGFQQQQQALAQSFSAMMAQGGTPQQMAAWQQQNASQLAALQQQAQQLAAASAAAWAGQPMPLISEVEVPEGATPEMANFLATRADLSNRAAQLHNQQTPNAPTVFQQQNGAELQAYQQQAQVIAAQSAPVTMPLPPPLQIPPNATPQMAAFLTARDQIIRSQIQMQNQYANADPATRQAALAQWQQQNAAQLQQLQTLAQNLSTTTTN